VFLPLKKVIQFCVTTLITCKKYIELWAWSNNKKFIHKQDEKHSASEWHYFLLI
jgi:hypothetical protein